MNEKNAKRYNIAHVEPLNKGDQSKGIGTGQFFVNQVGEVETSSNGKRFMRVRCSGRFPKSAGWDFTFGDGVRTPEDTVFVTVTFFEPLVDVFKDKLEKGNLIHVGGTFTKSEYTKKDGNTGYNMDVIAQACMKIWPQEEGKSRNFNYVNRLNVDEIGKAWGCLTVRVVKPLEVKKTSAANEVGEMRVVGNYQNASGIPWALGEVLDPKDGTLFIDLSYWGFALDNAKKVNPQPGSTLMIHGHFETREFTRSDGTVGKSVVCRDVKKFDVISFGKKKTDDASAAPAAPAAPATEAAPAPVATDSDEEFQAPASFGDIVVPF